MCWDEFYFNKHAKHKYAFIMMDFRKKVILDILESRWVTDLSSYFHEIPYNERIQVKYIVIDMYKNYRSLAKTYSKNKIICIDPSHVIIKVNDSLNSTRKRIMRRCKND